MRSFIPLSLLLVMILSCQVMATEYAALNPIQKIQLRQSHLFDLIVSGQNITGITPSELMMFYDADTQFLESYNLDAQAQIDTLSGIINGTKTAGINIAQASKMLSKYPTTSYQQFGCINASNQSDYYLVNLTANAQLGYNYIDAGNNSWSCQWMRKNYTAQAMQPSIDCSVAAQQDWDAWCYSMQTGGNDIDCSNPNLQMKAQIQKTLAGSSQTNQWKCAHPS